MSINQTQQSQFINTMVMKGIIPANSAGADIFENNSTSGTEDSFAPVERVDRELSSGIMPEELKCNNNRVNFDHDKAVHGYRTVSDIVPFTIGGTIFGLSLTEVPAITDLLSSVPVNAMIPCAIAGSITGAVIALLRRKNEDCGNVSVEIDGKKMKAPYYIDPNHYLKNPEMLRFTMTAQGLLGDRISAHTLKEGDIPSNPNAAILKELKKHSNELTRLAGERRLVASFGDKSRYGKEALQIIDASLACNLIASGKEVFLVNGLETTDIPHHYTADCLKGNKTTHITAMKETYDYQETKFKYSLTPINSATDLENIKDASGIPEGIMGVYKDSDTYSEVVFSDKQYGYSDVKNRGSSSSKVENYAHSTTKKVAKPSIETATDVKPRFVNSCNYPFLLGLIGAIAGGITASTAGIMGLPAGALMAGGFMLGKSIGKIF